MSSNLTFGTSLEPLKEQPVDFFLILAILAGVVMVAGAIGFVVWWIRN